MKASVFSNLYCQFSFNVLKKQKKEQTSLRQKKNVLGEKAAFLVLVSRSLHLSVESQKLQILFSNLNYSNVLSLNIKLKEKIMGEVVTLDLQLLLNSITLCAQR